MSNIDKQTLPIIDMLDILPVDFNNKVKEISNQVFYDIMINGEAYYSIDKNANVTRLTREEIYKNI